MRERILGSPSRSMHLEIHKETWFPQMILQLLAEWHEEMLLPTLIHLRVELDKLLQDIRHAGNIQTPIINCPKCGKAAHAVEPRVSVCAMILALARFDIASQEQVNGLEKAWAQNRKQRQLDIEGKAPAARVTFETNHDRCAPGPNYAPIVHIFGSLHTRRLADTNPGSMSGLL